MANENTPEGFRYVKSLKGIFIGHKYNCMKSKLDELAEYARPIVFSEPLHITPPFNWVGHLPFAFWLVDVLRPKIFVELGTHTGVSYFGFCQAVKALEFSTACYAVDTWKGDPQCGLYGEEVYQSFIAHHNQHYASFSRALRETFDEARAHFEPGTIDLLHIDGYHTYDAIQHDIDTWLPTLSESGIMLLHDINVRERDFGTARVWAELSSQYPNFSFLHAHGLGVLVPGPHIPSGLQAMVSAEKDSPERMAHIRDFFATLGNRITDRASQRIATQAHLEGFQHQVAQLREETVRLQIQVQQLQEASREHEQDRGHLSILQRQIEARNVEFREVNDQLELKSSEVHRLIVENSELATRLCEKLFVGAHERRQAARLLQQVGHLRNREYSARSEGKPPSAHRKSSLRMRVGKLHTMVGAFGGALSSLHSGNFRSRYTENKFFEIIQQSKLFDKSYYVRSYPDAAQMELDPIRHYLRQGNARGYNPHPLFDTNYYLKSNSDVAASGINPFVHFIVRGGYEGRSPSPLFDTSWYHAHSNWRVNDTTNPLTHYLSEGRFEGSSPHVLFDIDFYLANNLDVTHAGLDPLTHYVSVGAAEGRRPHPLFDPEYYWARVGESVPAKSNPLIHYLLDGGQRGISPHFLFDAHYYLEQHPEIVRNNLTPLIHYVTEGWHHDSNPHPLFDSLYYRTHAPNLSDHDIPLVHFVELGLPAGLSPNPSFDCSFYCMSNQDVALSRMAPFEHYVRHGCSEGRVANASQGATYAYWLSQFSTLSESDLTGIRRTIAEFAYLPRISITFNPEGWEYEALKRTLDSLSAQVYENWNLVVPVTDAVSDESKTVLSRCASLDSRITLIPCARSSETLEPLNEAVRRCDGEFIAVLDCGVCLSAHALYLILHRLQGDRHEVSFLYSDTDRFNDSGRRWRPHLKPDWDPYLLYSLDYVTGFLVLARRVWSDLGGFRAGFNGAEGFDLMLRALERSDGLKVVHLPFIVAHLQDIVPPAVARKHLSDPVDARTRSVTNHFERQGVRATVERSRGATLHVSFALPTQEPSVTLIIPTRDRTELLQSCIASILDRTTYRNYEILVVDNDSVEPSTHSYFSQLRHNPRVRIIPYRGSFNYAAINNEAVRQASGEIVGFINNDIEVISPTWLSELVAHVTQPGIGAVGAKLYYPNDTIQHAGVVIGKNGVAGHIGSGKDRYDWGDHGMFSVTRQLCAVTAACMLMRRADFLTVHGFDELAFGVAFNDIDLCLRLRDRGAAVLYVPAAELYHHESASRGPESNVLRRPHFERECAHFQKRWHTLLESDPFYNPNLSLGPNDYALAPSPRLTNPWKRPSARLAWQTSRDSRLDPYAKITNLERSIEVVSTSADARFSRRAWEPGLAIVILNLDKPEFINPLLDDLVLAKRELAEEGLSVDIIVGDTGSTNQRVLDKFEELREEVQVERHLPYHFSRCNNNLFERCVTKEAVLFLNNDIIFSSSAVTLREALQYLHRNAHVGIVGSYLLYPDDRIQHAGIEFFREGPLRGFCYHTQHGQPMENTPELGTAASIPAVTGAWLMIKSALFARLGGFDERYNTECQDVALCLAARRIGYESHLMYAGKVIHLENGTRPKSSEDWSDRQRFVRKWEAFVEAM